MLLLGIDIGTSFIKVSVVDADAQRSVASAQYPEMETQLFHCNPAGPGSRLTYGGSIPIRRSKKLITTNQFDAGKVAAIVRK